MISPLRTTARIGLAVLLAAPLGVAAQQPPPPQPRAPQPAPRPLNQGPELGQPVRVQPFQSAPIVGTPMQEAPGSFMPLAGHGQGASVAGLIQNHLGQLVPNAGTIVLRSLETGEIVAQTQVNELGQFAFRNFNPGLYSAELVTQSGAVVATTQAFSAGVGEIIQLAPVIPSAPVTSFAYFVGTGTTTAVNSAASAGVLPILPGPPVSPNR